MTTGLKIKQVADATGLTTATLRYYEEIGLLPEAPRTAAGYRTYDQRTLDRLAFINRAKQLGCTARGDRRSHDGVGRWPVRPDSGPAARARRCEDRRCTRTDRGSDDLRRRAPAGGQSVGTAPA
jgi:MerR family transcriptional regulator, copper efflux regulator